MSTFLSSNIPPKFTSKRPLVQDGQIIPERCSKNSPNARRRRELATCFRARHSTTLQSMGLADHVTLHFNMSAAAVLFHTEKTFDTTWHNGLLHKLPEFYFSASKIKLISSFLSNRTFKVMAECEIATPREIQVGVAIGSVLSPTVYSLHINNTPPPRRPYGSTKPSLLMTTAYM
jgi:hypothetical protein